MAQEDVANASPSDTHSLLDDPHTEASIKLEQVDVVGSIPQPVAREQPKFDAEPSKETYAPAESSRGPSLSTAADQHSEVGSVHSMPAVLISEPTSPMIPDQSSAMPSSSASTLSTRPPPLSPSRSQTLQEPVSQQQLQQQRRARHRSVVEGGRSANRLSGFFNNLMNRRDVANSASREPIREDLAPSQSQSTSARVSESASRPVSPPPPRPVTPPPALPPPTLSELGLSLSVLTSDLSPSHFSTPPTSGAFLAPHFLLLCHAQGLDVLPLVSPPAPQPYALVRRVSFKSVVVMEQRGVLVAIAGRRDGVRVYALEEVKKAIEWRIEFEVKRERERLRRETLKKSTIRSVDGMDLRDTLEKRKVSLSTPPPGDSDRPRLHLLRKASHGPIQTPPSPPPVPLIPRAPVARPAARTPRSASVPMSSPPPPLPEPFGHPPPYTNTDASDSQIHLRSQPSALSLRARSRGGSGSVSTVLSAALRRRESSRPRDPESKVDWAESSEDEAIDIVAAGVSGSQALDERTSATLSATRSSSSTPLQPLVAQPPPTHSRARSGTLRRNRPSNLDLSLANSSVLPPEQPSPVPTLLTLRQALSQPAPSEDSGHENVAETNTTLPENDDEDDGRDARISLAQALLESRLPDLPPLGSTQPQQPILLNNEETASLQSSTSNLQSSTEQSTRRRRRRWSVLINSPAQDVAPSLESPPLTAPADRSPHRFTRSYSFRSGRSRAASTNSAAEQAPSSFNAPTNPISLAAETPAPPTSRSSRFLPRIFSNALHGRRSDDRALLSAHASDSESQKPPASQLAVQAPPPKLEYVKLPGTKNALMIKSVETARKSFLAILCGENGEKVELFAGTYRTALGLSRTFILPDSPRSLELQLQGDDLVEVFLVFSQNVFGLEPATVRVREVRIGRAERRAARRRARETRVGEAAPAHNDGEAQDDDMNVNVSIGVTVSVGSNVVATGDGPDRAPSPTLVANEHPTSQLEIPSTPTDPTPTTTTAHPEELLAVAVAHMGPYTTFQQLSFAPRFPLASISDEYIIPPTYPSFLQYRAEHESDSTNNEGSRAQFSPPGLPVPTPTTPPKWLYRDPKGVVHGPWKSSLMQAWYKDGLLPPDLPVRREEDDDFTLLKELRLQCVDPTHPFRPPPICVPQDPPGPPPEAEKPLLSPISLLCQPRHFGPPALFFSSRGGHSTTIVDSRGRSVLKGRFVWSDDENPSEESKILCRMGDIKRLEAFDVQDRSVLVAMRQGGLEAVDLRDALLKPADESRRILPQFNPPLNSINRRPPFVWRIGTPIAASPMPLSALTHKHKGGFGHLASKKPSIGSAKSHGKTDSANDLELDPEDEVFFVGRKEDELYVCERNAGSFRILKLSPS